MTDSLKQLVKSSIVSRTTSEIGGKDDSIGTLLAGKYRVLGLIGAGAMAKVYRAVDVILDRVVAIKVLHTKDTSTHKRFAREMRVHGNLHHANIVEALDCIITDSETYFVMEYLDGANLEEVLVANNGRLCPQDIAYIVEQISSAFSYAHGRGVIHRDLKPGNVVLVVQDDIVTVKIVDFGLAKVLDHMQKITKTGQVVGSPMYMSPEQCLGKALDQRTDIYSLGVIVYELATGELPYNHLAKILDVMEAHANPKSNPKPIFELALEIALPVRLNKTIMTAMATELEKRYVSVDRFSKAINVWYQLSLKKAPDDKVIDSHKDAESGIEDDLIESETQLANIWQIPELVATSYDGEWSKLQIQDLQFNQVTEGEIVNDRYKILEILGQGGMSVVYRARNLESGQIVAAKTLKLSSINMSDRFLREIRIHTKLRHPNIVKALDHFQIDNGQVYFVMELLDGITLESYIFDTEISDDLALKCSILGQICDALEYAHDLEVVHRDLKPDNIMIVDQSGSLRVKVLDFGLAKIQDDLQQLTKTGVLLGTPEYMSPEHCNGNKVDKRSDLYSFGILAFEMLSGKLPFLCTNDIEYVEAHTSLDVIPISIASIRPDLPQVEILEEIFSKLLEKDPDKRFQSIEELKQKLTTWWQSTGVSEVSPFRTIRRRKRRVPEEDIAYPKPDPNQGEPISEDLDSLVGKFRDVQIQTFAASRKEQFITPEFFVKVKLIGLGVAIIVFGIVSTFAYSYFSAQSLKNQRLEEAKSIPKSKPEVPLKTSKNSDFVVEKSQKSYEKSSVYGSRTTKKAQLSRFDPQAILNRKQLTEEALGAVLGREFNYLICYRTSNIWQITYSRTNTC